MARPVLFLLLFAGLLDAAPAPAPEKLAAPKSGPPRFHSVQSVDTTNETVQVGVTFMVPYQVAKNVTAVENINGQQVQVTRMVVENMYKAVSQVHHLSLKSATASTGAGKKLTKEELWKELKGNRMILVTTEGEELDPAYRSVLAKDALIIHMPKAVPATVTPALPDIQPMVEGIPVPLPVDPMPKK